MGRRQKRLERITGQMRRYTLFADGLARWLDGLCCPVRRLWARLPASRGFAWAQMWAGGFEGLLAASGRKEKPRISPGRYYSLQGYPLRLNSAIMRTGNRMIAINHMGRPSFLPRCRGFIFRQSRACRRLKYRSINLYTCQSIGRDRCQSLFSL